MTLSRFAVALTLVNFAILAGVALQGSGGRAAPAGVTVLRAQAIELVDGRGLLRASLKTETDGGVILRMMDQRGEIRIKLGADRSGSALLLADDTAEVGIHLLSGISQISHRRETMITLADPAGAKRIIRASDTQSER
jgi:hypothetical protein